MKTPKSLELASLQGRFRVRRPKLSVGLRGNTVRLPATSSGIKISFSKSVMGGMVHPSPTVRPDKPIMRNPDCDQGAALVNCEPFRSRDGASTNHFGSTVYPGFLGQNQSHFERRPGLSPFITVKQHSRTTDVFGGAPVPVACTIGSIAQRDLQFEALGSRLFA